MALLVSPLPTFFFLQGSTKGIEEVTKCLREDLRAVKADIAALKVSVLCAVGLTGFGFFSLWQQS